MAGRLSSERQKVTRSKDSFVRPSKVGTSVNCAQNAHANAQPFFLDEKGPCPGSIHIERNHQGLQPKVNEFKSKNESYQTTRLKPQSKLTPPVLRTHYRPTKGAGTATQRVTRRGKQNSCQLQHDMDGTALLRVGLQKSQRCPPSMFSRGTPRRHPLEVLAG
jgi:hypothetical protein